MHTEKKERLYALLSQMSPNERRKTYKKAAKLRDIQQRKQHKESYRYGHSKTEDSDYGGKVPLVSKSRDSIENCLLKVLESLERSSDAQPEQMETESGTVSSIGPGTCRVLAEGRTIICTIDSDLTERQKSTIAVGDKAAVRITGPSEGHVIEILPRKNEISRPDPHCREIRRSIAANLDLAIIVASIKEPDFRPGLIDRILTVLFTEQIKPILIINKIDLVPDEELNRQLPGIDIYRQAGVEVFAVSAHSGAGIEDLRNRLTGMQSAFVGHSGVGKSSLLNKLFPELVLKTNTVRKSDGKGRHTTSSSLLHDAGNSTRVIDCPGIREFSADNLTNEQIRAGFPEFNRCSADCGFSNCTHTFEPHCAVRKAVQEGKIASSRYNSYRKLVKGADEIIEAAGQSFVCAKCGYLVSESAHGSNHRNHCPKCLWSKHLDNNPGDRKSACGGLMEPVTVWVRKDGEWAVIHRCCDCGALHSNRIAGDDNEFKLLSIAMKPIAGLPFPVEKLAVEES